MKPQGERPKPPPIERDAQEREFDSSPSLRVDRWLWAVRVCKTRALAADACKSGHVKIAGNSVKSSRQVRIGTRVDVMKSGLVRRLEVIGLPQKRVGAKLAPRYVVDHTPRDEIERWNEEQRNRRESEAAFQKSDGSSGRPTKRERRQMEVFLRAVKK